MFDSHAHYDDKQFDEDRDILISSLFEQGVKGFLNASSDIASSYASLALAHKYENVYAAVGIHPHEAAEVSEDWLNELDKISSDKKAVAIGEIGLDYHYDFSPRDIQMKVFEAQMAFAEKKNMPVVIHDREAHGDTLAVIDKFPNVKGVLHSFSGSYEMAEYLVRKGWYISFSGSVTFKTAEKLRHAVTAVPIDRVMCETDAPYLTPVPLRGKRNDSVKMRHTVEKLAEIYGISFEEMAEICLNNAYTLFGIVK
jgi:TatD DNase family protein